ncbi:MAG: M1 family metallopeptidase [Bacteroidales bacterium]|nr:M1 family metallopeptidase [Bacteroidales bacterium]MCB8999874.1 M1 family metallopeptidase [Bacteroidales bacterium]
MKKLLLISIVFSQLVICYPQGSYIPRDIKKAYENNTRSEDGRPGSAYFQNRVNYSIDAEFFPETRLLKGKEKITYHNNSPYIFRYMTLRLYQNIFVQGGVRGRPVDASDTNDGVKITSLTIKGQQIDLENDHWLLYHTQTNIFIPFECDSSSQETLEIGWEFTMPSQPYDRFGGYDKGTFFMGYWFPQVATFDDINGWDIFDYNNVAEFYNEYGNFDVRIKVPENYIVWGAGSLQNPEELLQDKYLERYKKAQDTGEVVHIITAEDRINDPDITRKGSGTWHFTSENVNDFAFATSNSYVWDGSAMENRSGKKISLQSAYNPKAENFDKVIEISKWNIKELETNIVGVDYPYPVLTAFNGIGGMEYPMMINDHDGSLSETIFVTSHEIAHSYFPFLVGTNQRRNGWFDEGLVTMLGMEVQFTRDSSFNLRKNYNEFYQSISGSQLDIPQPVNSIDLTDNVFQVHEYIRPSLAFWALRDIMGKELFNKCLEEFINRWSGKHPTPWDFFNTCNNVSGEDYSWFFNPWLNGFAYTDLAINSASYKGKKIFLNLENIGGMPIPSKLIVTFKDGSTLEKSIDGKSWSKSRLQEIIIKSKKQPSTLLLDTSGYPDSNGQNNNFEFSLR